MASACDGFRPVMASACDGFRSPTTQGDLGATGPPSWARQLAPKQDSRPQPSHHPANPLPFLSTPPDLFTKYLAGQDVVQACPLDLFTEHLAGSPLTYSPNT